MRAFHSLRPLKPRVSGLSRCFDSPCGLRGAAQRGTGKGALAYRTPEAGICTEFSEPVPAPPCCPGNKDPDPFCGFSILSVSVAISHLSFLFLQRRLVVIGSWTELIAFPEMGTHEEIKF